MKAIVYQQYGGPEVLKMQEVEKPVPKDDEVLVKVKAVSINDWDWSLMKGDAVNRMINGFKKPRIQILGSDIAGIVETIGKSVKSFTPGDEVYGDLSNHWGGFAEYVCAPEKNLAIKPPQMLFTEAAALPQAGMLAVQGLMDCGNIRKAERVLINGAGGGVGTIGIQIAKLYKAEVTGVDNSFKQEQMLSLGFDHVLDYTKDDFTSNSLKYDLILDVKTYRSVLDYARALKPGGRYVTAGGSIGRLFQALLYMPLFYLFSKKRILIVNLKINKDLQYLNELYEAGKLKPVIEKYDFEDYQQAFLRYGSMQHFGKVVLEI
ncbi:MAG: NAD(P)-dependent alcohol dehydrogenase [Flavisolibacter sp.]